MYTGSIEPTGTCMRATAVTCIKGLHMTYWDMYKGLYRPYWDMYTGLCRTYWDMYKAPLGHVYGLYRTYWDMYTGSTGPTGTCSKGSIGPTGTRIRAL
eukprot:4945206-Pyramimonas_sp.AAC.1